jgi:hypothetical protein
MAHIQVADNPIDVVVEPPVGTVIFSALTARRLYASSNSPPGGGKGAGGTEPLDQFLRDLHRSFAFSLKFIKDDQIRFDPVRVWHPAKDSPRLDVRDAVEDKPASREAWHVEPWELKKREWEEATKESGIIYHPPENSEEGSPSRESRKQIHVSESGRSAGQGGAFGSRNAEP